MTKTAVFGGRSSPSEGHAFRRTGSGLVATQGGVAAATCCAVVLAVALPMLFTPLTFGTFRQTPAIMAYGILLYSALRISKLMLTGREALVDATFWIFVYVFFGLAALAQTVTQKYALPPSTTYSEATQVNALSVIIAGLLAYDIGRIIAKLSRKGKGFRAGDNLHLVYRRIIVLAILGLVVAAVFLVSEGISLQFSSRQAVETSLLGTPRFGIRLDQIPDKAAAIIKITLRWLPTFLALYLLLCLRKAQKAADPRTTQINTTTTATMYLLLRLLLIANLIFNNPVSNSRSRFGGVAIALSLAMVSLQRPSRFRIAVSVLIFALLFVYPLAAAYRNTKRQFNSTPLAKDLVSSPDFSMFQQELNAQLYVNSHGYTLGHQVIGSIFVFVPRRLWPGKPQSTGDLISRTNVINASDSLWAEAYVDGGYVAVICFFLLYGFLSLGFEVAYLQRKPGTFSAAGVLVPLFAAFQILVLRGPLQPDVGELGPVVVLLILCVRRRDR